MREKIIGAALLASVAAGEVTGMEGSAAARGKNREQPVPAYIGDAFQDLSAAFQEDPRLKNYELKVSGNTINILSLYKTSDPFAESTDRLPTVTSKMGKVVVGPKSMRLEWSGADQAPAEVVNFPVKEVLSGMPGPGEKATKRLDLPSAGIVATINDIIKHSVDKTMGSTEVDAEPAPGPAPSMQAEGPAQAGDKS